MAAPRTPFLHPIGMALCGVLLVACASKSTTTASTASTSIASTSTTRGAGTTTTTRGSTAPALHQSHLADHETVGIASQLTTVPGYRYADVDAIEVSIVVATLHKIEKQNSVPGFFRNLSLHSVISDKPADNTAVTNSGAHETGYLQLYEFATPPTPSLERGAATLGLGALPEIRTGTSGATTYHVFRDDSSVDSKWRISWYRHGVQGVFDGATLPEVERWVRAYLQRPELQPEESDALAAALVSIPGYGYANWWEQADADGLHRVFGPVTAASAHSVIGVNETCCELLLAVPTSPKKIADLETQFVPGTAAPQTRTIAGTKVWRGTGNDGTVEMWTNGPIVATVLGRNAATTDAFVAAYLSARHAGGVR